MKGARHKPHTTSLVLLLACIFVFWWGISLLAQPVQRPVVAQTLPKAPQQEASPLIVHESISKGVYTYEGSYTPLACDSLGSGIRYNSNDGGHVSVLLITQPAGVACAQAAGNLSGQSFSVSIKVKGGLAPVFDGVLLNGQPIPAQLVEGN